MVLNCLVTAKRKWKKWLIADIENGGPLTGSIVLGTLSGYPTTSEEERKWREDAGLVAGDIQVQEELETVLGSRGREEDSNDDDMADEDDDTDARCDETSAHDGIEIVCIESGPSTSSSSNKRARRDSEYARISCLSDEDEQ